MSHALTTFSFGAGVQSTALMLLLKHEPQVLRAAMGTLPSVAFFADTGAEPATTYAHLERLQVDGLPIPLKVLSRGSILDAVDGSRSFAPYYTRNEAGEVAMLMRKCTKQFKIEPIEKAMRLELGLKPRQRSKPRSVGLWLGISTDEVVRMKQNQNRMIDNLYPLIEIGWDRRRCQEYNHAHGFRAPKSRCFFCPFIRDWARIQREEPEEFRRAVEFDERIRKPHAGFQREAYLHRLCLPLPDALADMARREHATTGGMDPLFPEFAEECEGHCGV